MRGLPENFPHSLKNLFDIPSQTDEFLFFKEEIVQIISDSVIGMTSFSVKLNGEILLSSEIAV